MRSSPPRGPRPSAAPASAQHNGAVASVSLYVSQNALPPSEDDERLAAALRRRGAEVRIVTWDDPDAGWSDVGVLCSTWDYTARFAEFRSWLEVADRQCTLLNPLALVRRSLTKAYLLDLAEAGVPTVPTTLTTSDPAEIRAVALEQGWDDVVLKPLVSAGGRQVRRASIESIPDLPRPLDGAPEGWLVQPLLPAIADGEYSCVFVAGELTHTVLKRAAEGEFRVQAGYGGVTALSVPPEAVRTVAASALQLLGPDHVYARVDVVVDPALGALIMEVEMVEPDLFLRFSDHAAERLADAVLGRV